MNRFFRKINSLQNHFSIVNYGELQFDIKNVGIRIDKKTLIVVIAVVLLGIGFYAGVQLGIRLFF